MSNQGVRGYYQITETIKTNLLADENVNTVTTGDIFDIDLSKQTIFPLSHIIINSVTIQEQILNDASCEFFYERFENQMAGVACTFNVLIANDINVCN
jgi:hypothetical protein